MTSRKSLGFQDSQPAPAGAAAFRTLPAGIWALGFGSSFMDISSELIHSLLPIFMSVMLGTSMATIGLVEGVAEAIAAVTKVFSGAIGAPVTFLAGGVFAALTAFGLLAYREGPRPQ